MFCHTRDDIDAMEVVVAASQVQISARDQILRQSPLRTRLLSRKKWGINQMTTLRWSLEEDLRNYRDAGVTRIGLSRTKLADYSDEQAADLIRQSGLTPTSLSWAGGFTGSNGFDYQESLHDAIEAIETARFVGAPVVVFITGGQGAFTPRHGRGLVAESLKLLGEKAARSGIRLALQPMHRKFARKTSLVSDLAEGIELIEQVNHPAVGLVIDLFALGNLTNFMMLLPEAVKHCALVTLGDAPQHPSHEYDRLPLGEGVLPIIPAILALEKLGYRGSYEFQSLSDSTWGMDYRQVIDDASAYFDQEISETPVSD